MTSKSLKLKLISLLLAGAMIASLSGCVSEIAEDASGSVSGDSYADAAADVDVQQADFDSVKPYSQNGATNIILNGSSITSEGTGCVIDGSTVTITREGTYTLSGSLDGQVIIDAGGEKIRLVLNGVDITCENSSPLYIKDSKKVILTLADGTQNILTDGSSYEYDDAAAEEPSAALFSKADLIIEGNGCLTVNANFNNGIQSKDTLEIHSGTYVINSANHGITGKDSLSIKDGSFTINAGGDGMRSNNADDSSLGWISIVGGSFAINASQDGIQAESTLHIGGGSYALVTGGGSANSSSDNDAWGDWQQGNNMPGWGGHGGGRGGWSASSTSDSTSAKAIKAGADVLIEEGTIAIDSSDDALHSNGDLSITGGTIDISSGDDGIHADATMNISGGTVNIAKSYEGIEGVAVNISGGYVNLVSSDDGINSAGGNDGSGSDRPGANMFAVDDRCDVVISGGVVIADAGGDGIDSNGNIHLSGGTIVVYGPTNSGNGPFDYAGELIVTGGNVAVCGSAGMAQGASGSSTQANMLLCFNGTIEGGTLLALTDKSGNVVYAVTPEKNYASVFVSVPSMSVGDDYTLWLGGSCNGESHYGIYTDGTLTGATEITEVTVSEISTYYGGYSGMGGGMGMGGGPGGPGGHGPGR